MLAGLWDSYCLYKFIGHLSPPTANILGLNARLPPPPPVLVLVSLSENSKYSTPFSSSLSSTSPRVNCLLLWDLAKTETDCYEKEQSVLQCFAIFCSKFLSFPQYLDHFICDGGTSVRPIPFSLRFQSPMFGSEHVP